MSIRDSPVRTRSSKLNYSFKCVKILRMLLLFLDLRISGIHKGS